MDDDVNQRSDAERTMRQESNPDYGGNPRVRYSPRQDAGSQTDPMTAAQHQARMLQMQVDQLHRELDVCHQRIDQLERQHGNMQRGRSSTGRFTSGPGSAGSRGYGDNLNVQYEEYSPRQVHHVHHVNGYTGPEIPYTEMPPGQNMQHWRGRGRGGYGGGYGFMPFVDPFVRDMLYLQALGSLQYEGNELPAY